MLSLYVSNRLETLAKKLAEVLNSPLASPLAREVIVVQSKGMERWVSLQLASCHGIWANCAFPFPNALVREILGPVIGVMPNDPAFAPEVMTWKVMRLLPACVQEPGFESLRRYLRDADELKRFQLAARIAQTFDQYLVYRPDLVLGWERGEECHWQAVLWRALATESDSLHWARIRDDFLRKARAQGLARELLPERISVFGIAALPRFHLEVIAEAARLIPVHLFLMNPCQEYWGQISSEREARRVAARYRPSTEGAQDLHLEKGNSLLASLGGLGRDFLEMVYAFEGEEQEFFEEPEGQDLLSAVQSDILHLQEARGEKKRMLQAGDRSLQVHSCHSPMREIEVLHDNLLALFEAHPGLGSHDVLVMTPNIEEYAPFIHAVFDSPGQESLRIPYSIADRSLQGEGSVANTLLAILALASSRFTAVEVCEILETGWVYRRFGMSEADVDLVKRWTNEAGVRWGIDAAMRRDLGLPQFSEYSWRFGIGRLLLGYALPGEDRKLFQGVLPYDRIEGEEVEVLGKFLDFLDALISVAASLSRPRTLPEWSRLIAELLDRFFLADLDAEREIAVIRTILADLARDQEVARFEETVGGALIQSYVQQAFAHRGLGLGFLTGGVTFATMLPMRSIPFKVICLVGMNAEAYPRQARRVSFDLMAREPRPGDRSRRSDDRYLFLEALLSARKVFYLSYVGQSIQDNSAIPPSVVVSELMDYVEREYCVPEGTVSEMVMTRHRLQAFNREYFRGGGTLFSFSDENCQAAQRSQEARVLPRPFLSRGLSAPGPEWKRPDLQALGRFFAHPARFLLRERLGIHLEERLPAVQESEPFELAGLERYVLEQQLLEWRLAGHDLKEAFAAVEAAGALPVGSVGEWTYEQVRAGVEQFADLVTKYQGAGKTEPVALECTLEDFALFGTLQRVAGQGLVHYRYGRITPRDRVSAWITHLALQAAEGPEGAQKSVLLGLGENREPVAVAFEPLPRPEAEGLLHTLLQHYWQGLTRPLHFFSKTSWEYARLVFRGTPDDEALEAARQKWQSDEPDRGEQEGLDPYHQLCFSAEDVLDREFKGLARQVLLPLLRGQKEGHGE